jgi:A/G-specific adenine glycosylase
MTKTETFANRLLHWWRSHGRHDLPWQIDRTPYRVWVAEIMLQQTQVVTVIGYFERFMACFPDLESLAMAELDEVLALWSGLGYYARARNLHAAARQCVEVHGGQLPDSAEDLHDLPGIGESTANAIIAQAHDRRAPILDGNVKRVLARHAGIEGWPGRTPVARRLWQEADSRTPPRHARDYTQAVMDLGATVCTPRRPDCETCPVSADCIARIDDRVDQLPTRKPPRQRPRRQVVLAVVENDQGEILLERRPPTGIWGGLWSLPEMQQLEVSGAGLPLPSIEHHFTHFTLEIEVRRVRVDGKGVDCVSDGSHMRWMAPGAALETGLPQPIRQILESLQGD